MERDPAQFQAMLTRLLERSKQFQAKIESIQKRLKSGTPASEVRADFDQALRDLGGAMPPPMDGDVAMPAGGPNGGPGGGFSADRPGGPDLLPGDLPGARGNGPQGAGPNPGPNSGPGRGPIVGGGNQNPPKQLSPAERAQVTGELRQLSPAGGEEFDTLDKRDRKAADRFLEHLAPKLRPLIEHRDRNSADFALKREDLEAFVQIVRLTRRVAEERGGQNRPEVIAQLRAELRSAFGKQVDVRLKTQEQQLADLAARTERLKTENERAKTNKEKFVDDQVQRALDGKPAGKPGPKGDGKGDSKPEGKPGPR